jgi:hypothetical protein
MAFFIDENEVRSDTQPDDEIRNRSESDGASSSGSRVCKQCAYGKRLPLEMRPAAPFGRQSRGHEAEKPNVCRPIEISDDDKPLD